MSCHVMSCHVTSLWHIELTLRNDISNFERKLPSDSNLIHLRIIYLVMTTIMTHNVILFGIVYFLTECLYLISKNIRKCERSCIFIVQYQNLCVHLLLFASLRNTQTQWIFFFHVNTKKNLIDNEKKIFIIANKILISLITNFKRIIIYLKC
jgi:hypothetical protein